MLLFAYVGAFAHTSGSSFLALRAEGESTVHAEWDFDIRDLHQSLQTDGNGNITGTVDPVFHMNLLGADDSSVSIDDFMAGVVSTNGDSFIVQGPKGRQWTVQTSASDPLALGSTAAVLSATAIAACAWPALRATRLDPLVALRYE